MPRPPISNPPLHSWASTSLRRPSRIASRLNSWGSFVRCWSAACSGCWPRRLKPSTLLNKFTSVRIGDSSTIALPDELADQLPRLWRHLARGLAAMKIHLLWDFLTGSILQLRITPGLRQRRYQPDRPGVAPAGSLSLFDLGYFCLDRFREPHAGRCFLDLSAAAWHVGLRRPGPALGAVPDTCGSRQVRDRSTCRSCWA